MAKRNLYDIMKLANKTKEGKKIINDLFGEKIAEMIEEDSKDETLEDMLKAFESDDEEEALDEEEDSDGDDFDEEDSEEEDSDGDDFDEEDSEEEN